MPSMPAATSTPRVAVVVVNWARLDEPVEAAVAALRWRALDPLVIVVANECDPTRAERLRREAPGAQLLANPHNLGFAGANNRALRELLARRTDGDAPMGALLLNSDAVLSESAAEAMARALAERPGLAAVGVALREAGRMSFGGRDISLAWNTRSLAPPAPIPVLIDAEYVPGAAALLRLDAVAAVGLLDEDYFFSGEMADWCDRARAAGWHCGVLTSHVVEHAARDSAALRDVLYAYYSLRNRFVFIRKRARPRARVWAWAARGARMGASALARGRMAQARAMFAAVADGLRGRMGRAPDWLQP